MSAGLRIRSTVPSSAVEISRSSATSQLEPTPRASHWKCPVTSLIAFDSSARGSDSLRPSVSRIACFCATCGTSAKIASASRSQVLIAVPPDGRM